MRIIVSKKELNFLCERVYNYLEGYKLNESNFKQIVISFNLNEQEKTKLERKITRLKNRYFINNKILARAIVKLRYNYHKIKEIPFDENSPLAII